MNTIEAVAAAVTGARHLRASRNGQDAAAVWSSPPVHGAAGAMVAVVCDGCSSGASSEVGARLGASLFARAVGDRLQRGASISDQATWEAARDDVTRTLAELVRHLPADPDAALHDSFLFTVIGAAMTDDDAAVWAIGDGAYAIDDRACLLGPFADNQPPYLAYDLLGTRHTAHFEAARDSVSIVIATDGVLELAGEDLHAQVVTTFAARELVEHPDRLRRRLALLARPSERVDWEARRVVRIPAAVQDDCAVAVLRRTRSTSAATTSASTRSRQAPSGRGGAS
jgi:hypothetical protein